MGQLLDIVCAGCKRDCKAHPLHLAFPVFWKSVKDEKVQKIASDLLSGRKIMVACQRDKTFKLANF